LYCDAQVQQINSDNVKLCNRLVEISKGAPNPMYTNVHSVGTTAAAGAPRRP
jgi:hypothetical protein